MWKEPLKIHIQTLIQGIQKNYHSMQCKISVAETDTIQWLLQVYTAQMEGTPHSSGTSEDLGGTHQQISEANHNTKLTQVSRPHCPGGRHLKGSTFRPPQQGLDRIQRAKRLEGLQIQSTNIWPLTQELSG